MEDHDNKMTLFDAIKRKWEGQESFLKPVEPVIKKLKTIQYSQTDSDSEKRIQTNYSLSSYLKKSEHDEKLQNKILEISNQHLSQINSYFSKDFKKDKIEQLPYKMINYEKGTISALEMASVVIKRNDGIIDEIKLAHPINVLLRYKNVLNLISDEQKKLDKYNPNIATSSNSFSNQDLIRRQKSRDVEILRYQSIQLLYKLKSMSNQKHETLLNEIIKDNMLAHEEKNQASLQTILQRLEDLFINCTDLFKVAAQSEILTRKVMNQDVDSFPVKNNNEGSKTKRFESESFIINSVTKLDRSLFFRDVEEILIIISGTLAPCLENCNQTFEAGLKAALLSRLGPEAFNKTKISIIISDLEITAYSNQPSTNSSSMIRFARSLSRTANDAIERTTFEQVVVNHENMFLPANTYINSLFKKKKDSKPFNDEYLNEKALFEKFVDFVMSNLDFEFPKIEEEEEKCNPISNLDIYGCDKKGFFRACRDGIIQVVDEQKNFMSNEKILDGLTSLHIACRNKQLDIVEFLLNNGIDTNVKEDLFDDTPLHEACNRGESKIVKLLVDTNPSLVNEKNRLNQTPLHDACFRGYIDIVKVLIETKLVCLNEINVMKQTPLDVANDNWNFHISKLLIDNSAQSTYRGNLLHLAAKENNYDLFLLVLQQNPNIDINEIDSNNQTAFQVTKCKKIKQELEKRGYQKPKEDRSSHYLPSFRGRGPPSDTNVDHFSEESDETNQNNENENVVNIEDINKANGNTLLQQLLIFYMKNKFDLRIIKIVLDCNTELINKKNKLLQTPLHLACSYGLTNVISLFLMEKYQVNINEQDNNGQTPLHIACKGGYFDAVRKLLAHKNIQKSIKDVSNKAPIYYAYINGNLNILIEFFKNTSIEETLDLFSNDLNINEIDNQLIFASMSDLFAANGVISHLIESKNANVNATTSRRRLTPLIISLGMCCSRVVSLLLKNSNVDVNKADQSGCTPLHTILKCLNSQSVVVDGNDEDANHNDSFYVEKIYQDQTKTKHTKQNEYKYLLLLKELSKKDIGFRNNPNYLELFNLCGNYKLKNIFIDLFFEDINQVNSAGSTLLLFACQKPDDELVSILIERNADTSAKTRENGFNAFHIVAKNGSIKIACLLLNKEDAIDRLNETDHNDLTPIELAKINKKKKVANLFQYFKDNGSVQTENCLKKPYIDRSFFSGL